MPLPSSPPAPSSSPPPAAPRAAAALRAGPEPTAPAGKARSYERLVADADRLMENGQPVRAQKLLDEALAMQPNGVAALSGSAYLLLDRQRPLAAISVFKRALGISPEFPPALFGLAEAYRAQGELPAAAENYRKYIGVAPGGPDAPAARRQLRDLESLIPRKPAPEPPKAKYEEPAPAAAE
jgi:tetratricopeptide (TPR) repeat protein